MKLFWLAGLACLMTFSFSGCSEGETAPPATLNVDSASSESGATAKSESDGPVADSGEVVHSVSKPVIDELAKKADEAVGELKKETGEAIDAAGVAAQKKKDQYTAELKDKLENLKGDIADLKESAKDLKDEAKGEFAKKTDDLSQKREAFEGKLKELEDSSIDMWSNLKDGLTSAWAEFQKSFDDASKHVNDENAEAEAKASDDSNKGSTKEATDSK